MLEWSWLRQGGRVKDFAVGIKGGEMKPRAQPSSSTFQGASGSYESKRERWPNVWRSHEETWGKEEKWGKKNC